METHALILMSLSAHIYKTRTKRIRKPLHERGDMDISIGYFSNNWGLHNLINSDICLLDLEMLEYIKEQAIVSQEYVDEGIDKAGCYDDVNKDVKGILGGHQSVLSMVDEAIDAVKRGYIVYYSSSY